jgi:ABC-type multidrug transport system permease subunit
MFVAALCTILGAVILISIVLPWFLIAVFVVSITYFYTAVFYQASSRELKVRFASYTSDKRVYLMCICISALVNNSPLD